MKTIQWAILSIVAAVAAGCTTPAVLEHELNSPPLVDSEYFSTQEAKFNINFYKGTVQSRYMIALSVRRPLLNGGYLEAQFENPQDKNQPIIITRSIEPKQSLVVLESPIIYGRSSYANYEVVVYLYTNALKTKLLGEHRQLIRSLMDDI